MAAISINNRMDARASFIAGATAAGFTEPQAGFLWTAIPFHPLVGEWKRERGRDVLNETLRDAGCFAGSHAEGLFPIQIDSKIPPTPPVMTDDH